MCMSSLPGPTPPDKVHVKGTCSCIHLVPIVASCPAHTLPWWNNESWHCAYISFSLSTRHYAFVSSIRHLIWVGFIAMHRYASSKLILVLQQAMALSPWLTKISPCTKHCTLVSPCHCHRSLMGPRCFLIGPRCFLMGLRCFPIRPWCHMLRVKGLIVGALQYVIIKRPEVALRMNKVCQFMQRLVERMLRYFKMCFATWFTSHKVKQFESSWLLWYWLGLGT